MLSDILPRLKAGASSLNVIAQANPRLIIAPVAHRCPDGFDIPSRIMVATHKIYLGLVVSRIGCIMRVTNANIK